MKDQLEGLGDKVDRWANLIVNRYLHMRLVWKAFSGTIWSTITYPLPVMMLTEDQGECLTKKLYRKLLPSMGVNHNFPWAYLNVSKIFREMGPSEIMFGQMIDVVGYCMMHWTSDTLTGEAMRYSAEQVQIEIGMGTPFVQIPFKSLLRGQMTWSKKMRKNLGILEIELLSCDLPSLLLQREGGTYITEEFTGLYGMDKRKMRRLNCVRLSMEIYVMSDLAT